MRYGAEILTQYSWVFLLKITLRHNWANYNSFWNIWHVKHPPKAKIQKYWQTVLTLYFSKIHSGLSFQEKVAPRGSKSLWEPIFFKKKIQKKYSGQKKTLKWPDNSYLSKIKGSAPTRFLRFFGHKIWSNWARELRF